MRPQQQSHYYNALDPFLQAVMTQLYDEEEEHADKQQQCGEGSSRPCAPPNSNASAKGTTTESGKKKARAACAPRHTTTFKPNFDVYEGAEAYYVEGDLPGLSDKKVLNIEFSDDRTLVVSGRVDKAQPQPQPEAQPQQQQEEKDEEAQDDEQKSLKPTVEDTEDEDDFSVVSSSSSRDSHAEAEKKTAEKKTVAKESEEKPRKVWLAERTHGEFRRVFTFSTPVEVDGVTAKLADGLLAVEVPKKVNRGVKKIEVL